MNMPGQSQIPVCTTLAQFQMNDGQRVLVLGRYHAVALGQGTRIQNLKRDHASVRLGDGTEILLEPNWSDSARRDSDELSRFDNHQVEVEGVAHLKSPPPPQPIAYIIGPCLSPVFSLRLLSDKPGP